MVRFLLLLLGLWVALVVIGWVLKGLFWLAVGVGLFALGAVALNASRRR